MERISKINYYLDIAEAVSERSTCLRKKWGCLIVKNDEIIATGYNGAPRGRLNCTDLGYCTKHKILPDEHRCGYDACRSVHAEQNALLSSSRKDMLGSSLFLVGTSAKTENYGEYVENPTACQMCRKLIINSGIDAVYVRLNKTDYEKFDVEDWIKNDELLDGKRSY